MKYIIMSLRGQKPEAISCQRGDCFVGKIAILAITFALLASCAPVDLNAPMPVFDTGVDPDSWAQIPAGEFYYGQHNDIKSTDAYEIMVTDVTVGQYATFLNAAQADGSVKIPEALVPYMNGVDRIPPVGQN